MISKALFCTLNSKYIHASLAPCCLFTACKNEKLPCEIKVLEGTVNEDIKAVYDRIIREKPDFVSFSCYIWNIKKTLELCNMLKSKGVVIALGGPEVSYCQKKILKENSFVDYVLSGEGEMTMPLLLKALLNDNKPLISGVSFREGDTLVISDGEPADFEKTVSPYCEEYFESLGTRIAYIESSRGCPFSCAFCLSGRCGKVRFLPLDRVKNEMLILASKGAKTIKFVDRTFNCNSKRAGEILSFIKEEYGRKIPSGVCFHFEIAADILTEELFEVIATLPNGAVQFEVGIQSFNENTLKKINRKTNTDLVEKNVKRLLSYGNCHVHIDLIAGLPEEGYDSFVAGFDRAYKIGAHMLQLGFLKVLHGSPMAENKEEFPCTYSSEPPYEVVSTPYITKDELSLLHICENELERLYNSARFPRTLSYVTRFMPPYELFLGFGEFLISKDEKGSIALDKYTCLAYEYFSLIRGVDKIRLRDLMLLDRLSTNNSDILPSCLKIKDERLRRLKQHLSQAVPLKKGELRSVGILYSENTAVYCDYSKEKDPVKGQWKIEYVSIDRLD
ncbi:MAG: B12-binding domain-containing radical SAM protein [Clostridia bacterium]|nr:B12-binding domain-containing radical SAM protein [Clostridia bacterium]MBQ7296632.1 B12-binding domain-containing radical SAM protein [Clostridia bacterium]